MATYLPYQGYIDEDFLQKNGLARTTTPGGGSAFTDASGNLYIDTGGGLQQRNDLKTSSAPVLSTQTPPKDQGGLPTGIPDQGAPSAQGFPQSFTDPNTGQTYTLENGNYVTRNSMGGMSVITPEQARGYSGFAQKQEPKIPSLNIKTNLQPGSSGEDVATLQNWLIQQGYDISAATGYYGDQTVAAVTKWQQANNIDTKGNPGYFGPISRNFVAQATGKPIEPSAKTGDTGGTSTTSGGTKSDGGTPSSMGVNYDPSWSKYGITQDIWNGMNAVQQGVIATGLAAARSLYGANASNITLSQALAAAATDPNIIAKYSDALAIDKNVLQQQLQTLQTTTATDYQQRQTQFENERKALAEQVAQAGQTYSGYREQAKGQLGQSEQGIIQSSRSQLQTTLNNLTSQFESKYGTAATPLMSTQFNDPFLSSNVGLGGTYNPSTPFSTTLSGKTTGGITGSEPVAKQQDINKLASSYVQMGQLPT